MSALEPELGTMLRFLGDAGWKPALLAEGPCGGAALQWVCFPQGEVRVYAAFRTVDPLTAVRGLYAHALEHPNERPTFPPSLSSPLDQRGAVCERPCAAYEQSQGCRCVEHGLLVAKPATPPWWARTASGICDV